MAIGTAIRKHAGVATESDQLIPQAIIRDRDTFFDQPPVPRHAPAQEPRTDVSTPGSGRNLPESASEGGRFLDRLHFLPAPIFCLAQTFAGTTNGSYSRVSIASASESFTNDSVEGLMWSLRPSR